MKLKITVDQKTYEVDVEASEPEPGPVPLAVASIRPAAAVALPPPPPPATGPPVADEAKVCRSSVTGTVVRVIAHAGAAVLEGDTLLVLEAMKMETNITAPVAATVARITAGVGDAVKTGQVLVEFG
ncbi:MAG TPA: biotin/lipoyl-containing protein [Anaeromyxobacteraceae bacterium]